MSRRRCVCSLIAVVATLAACSGGTSGSAPDTSAPSAVPGATDTGSGSNERPVTPEGAEPSSSTESDGNPNTPAGSATDLGRLLLDVTEVGEGWTADPAGADADFGSLGDSACEDQFVDPVIVARVSPQAGVVFTSPKEFGITVSQAILEAPVEQLESDLMEVFRVDSACSGAEIALNDTTTARAERIELAQLGDQQQVARLSILVGTDVVSAGYIAIVRVGRFAIELSLLEERGATAAASTIEPADFEKLLKVAVRKLAD